MALLSRNTMRVNTVIILVIAGFLSLSCCLVSEGWAHSSEEEVYGVHVASFRDEEGALAQVRLLKEAGCPAFSTTLLLPGQGKWHRVFAGLKGSRKDALEQGELLQKRGVIERFSAMPFQGRPRDVPEQQVHGILVGSYRDRNRAAVHVQGIEEAGHSAFLRSVVLPGRGEWHRVFAGFHICREEALEQGELLQKQGVISNYSILTLHETSHENSESPPQASPKKTSSSAESSEPQPAQVTTQPSKELVLADPMDPMPDGSLEAGSTGEDGETPDASPVVQKREDFPAKKEAGSRSSTEIQKPLLESGIEIAERSIEQPPGSRLVFPRSEFSELEKTPAVAEAMADFRSGNYEAAGEALQAVLDTDPSDEGMKKFLSRRMADCEFMLAMEGSRSQVMAAIEGYREVLGAYPHETADRDEIHILMAEGYHSLGLYHEGLREVNRITEAHPPSPHRARALYLRGLSHYRLHGYERAIDAFNEYLRTFPRGADRRSALVFLGDSYSHREEYARADSAFNAALRLWPSLESVPRQKLLLLGGHYLRSGDYDKGLEVFLTWLNLYHDEPETPEMMYGTARILATMEKVPAALALLRQVVERYPETRQAVESMLVMADLGLRRTGRSLPCHVFDGMEYYLDPILAFDHALAESTERQRWEELLFLRTGALMKLGRYSEAFENALRLQVESPWSPYRTENIRYLVENAEYMIEGYRGEDDHLAVANIFLLSRRHGFVEEAAFESLFRSAQSLNEVGLTAFSRAVLERLLSRFRDEESRARTMVALASIELKEGFYEDAEKWADEALATTAAPVNPSAREARELLGDSAFKRNDFNGAERHYSVLATMPGSPENQARVLSKHGDSLQMLGRYPQAIMQYERAMRIAGENAALNGENVQKQSYEGIAECYYRLGQYEKSAHWYGLFMENVKEGAVTSWGRYRLGQSYARLSNRDRALKHFDVLKEQPGDPFWQRVAEYGQNYEIFRSRFERIASGR